jgi:hypothetical protein
VASFFVPASKDDEQAEQVWQATKKFAEQQLGWKVSDRRIYSLSGLARAAQAGRRSGGGSAVVGEIDERQDELVLVILESNAYLVCTQNRGVARGDPILVGREEVQQVIDFT